MLILLKTIFLLRWFNVGSIHSESTELVFKMNARNASRAHLSRWKRPWTGVHVRLSQKGTFLPPQSNVFIHDPNTEKGKRWREQKVSGAECTEGSSQRAGAKLLVDTDQEGTRKTGWFSVPACFSHSCNKARFVRGRLHFINYSITESDMMAVPKLELQAQTELVFMLRAFLQTLADIRLSHSTCHDH